MITPDDKTLDMIVFIARQVAVAMSGEYAELAASADDYRTMADVIAALRERIAALTAEREDWARRFILDGRTPWEWENLCKRAEAERDALRQDAQRYRWLRQNPWWLGWEHDMQAEKIDAALDDDIARAALEGKTPQSAAPITEQEVEAMAQRIAQWSDFNRAEAATLLRRLRAERDALRHVVAAADAMRRITIILQSVQWADYDSARAALDATDSSLRT